MKGSEKKISVPILSLSIYNYILNYLLHVWSWGKERWVRASWFMAHHMQLTHPTLEAGTTALTGSASFTNEKCHEETQGEAKHGGNKTNISGHEWANCCIYTEFWEVQRCLYLNKRSIFFSAIFSETDFRI